MCLIHYTRIKMLIYQLICLNSLNTTHLVLWIYEHKNYICKYHFTRVWSSSTGHTVNRLICRALLSTYGHGHTHLFNCYFHHTLSDLLLQKESHSVAHLVSIDGGEGDVEEEAIEDRFGYPLQRERQQQHWYANEDVGSQRRQTGLLNLDDTEKTHTITYKWMVTGKPPIDSYNATDNVFSGILLSVLQHIFSFEKSGIFQTHFPEFKGPEQWGKDMLYIFFQYLINRSCYF